ncbi:hypothetical protein GCM10010412_086830 [Nonomuraea recticatena]|uniref:Uncharacterized protein n=1 Tax=Nonomuraea recticatena TaxID=46178 RepID=A0ABP6FLZ4_9ACTN
MQQTRRATDTGLAAAPGSGVVGHRVSPGETPVKKLRREDAFVPADGKTVGASCWSLLNQALFVMRVRSATRRSAVNPVGPGSAGFDAVEDQAEFVGQDGGVGAVAGA